MASGGPAMRSWPELSAFEGTPLNIALRDCGLTAIALVGIAMEEGIEPTVRHAADLGLNPVIISDACGAGYPDAAKRSLDNLAFEGNSRSPMSRRSPM
jgi:nicotinamidase-related amidase